MDGMEDAASLVPRPGNSMQLIRFGDVSNRK